MVEPAPAAPAPAPIDETMTVNRVIHDFPHTRPVLERLFIDMLTDGYTCLDEVAWRHGMEAKDLVARLERAIDVCGCAQHAPAGIAVSAPCQHREGACVAK